MKVIIAGGRNITSYAAVLNAIAASGWRDEITEVVCGMASGVDLLGKRWAINSGIPVRLVPADWKIYGKAAGPMRNEMMAHYANALILIWDGKSKGSANMLMWARRHGLRIHEHIVEVES